MERIKESDIEILDTVYKIPNKINVSTVKHRTTNEILCMKKIYSRDNSHLNRIQSECMAMATLDHSNIVKLRSSYIGGTSQIEYVMLFMEYFREGDLESLISSRAIASNYFTEEELLSYLTQLISAYSYMQERKSSHRDIKPGNIFVADQGKTLKVADFGNTVKKDSNCAMTLSGTPLYLSPILRNVMDTRSDPFAIKHNVYKSDVYSLGITFLYMASLKTVDDLSNLDNLEEKIQERINELPNNYPQIKEILRKMLMVDEDLRPDFIELRGILKKKYNLVQININEIINLGLSKCEICEEYKQESGMYAINAQFICKQCYDKIQSRLYPDYEL